MLWFQWPTFATRFHVVKSFLYYFSCKYFWDTSHCNNLQIKFKYKFTKIRLNNNLPSSPSTGPKMFLPFQIVCAKSKIELHLATQKNCAHNILGPVHGRSIRMFALCLYYSYEIFHTYLNHEGRKWVHPVLGKPKVWKLHFLWLPNAFLPFAHLDSKCFLRH